MKLLITGSSGQLGKRITQALNSTIQEGILFLGDYKIERAMEFAEQLGENVEPIYFNKNDQTSVNEALQQCDFVINTMEWDDISFIKNCIQLRVGVIDVTVNPLITKECLMLKEEAKNAGVPIIVGAGFIPGLAGLLVKYAANNFEVVERIDLGFLQSANASTGMKGLLDMFQILSSNVYYHHNDSKIHQSAFSKSRLFHTPVLDKRKMWLTNFIERDLLVEKLKVQNINYWTGFDKPSLNHLIWLLNKIGFLRIFQNKGSALRWGNRLYSLAKHDPKKPETAYLIVEVTGRKDKKVITTKQTIVANSDYGATAECVCAMVQLLDRSGEGGVFIPLEVFKLKDILQITRNVDLLE